MRRQRKLTFSKTANQLLSSNQTPFPNWNRSKLLFPGRKRIYRRGLNSGRKTAGIARDFYVIRIFQSQPPKVTITRNIPGVESARGHNQL